MTVVFKPSSDGSRLESDVGVVMCSIPSSLLGVVAAIMVLLKYIIAVSTTIGLIPHDHDDRVKLFLSMIGTTVEA